MRFMMIYKPADVASLEKGVPPTQKEMEEMGAFIARVAQSGALLAADGLMASSTGARVQQKDGKVKVTDGPFTEAKELIGGFAIVQYPSKAEAIAMAKEFLKLAGDGESEIRQMYDVPAFPPPKN